MMRFKLYPPSLVLAVFVLVLFFTSNALAACTGSSPTWTSTPDQASVTSCISGASAGDTINVSAGSATWASNIVISGKTGLKIIGAGSANTLITGAGFALSNHADNTRISGFSFTQTGAYMYFDGSQGWRFDHNTVTRTTWDFCLWALGSINGSRSNTPSEGLIDHNNLTNCRTVSYGEYTDTGGSDRWLEPLNEGTQHALYAEDNTYTITDSSCLSGGAVLCNFMDANLGGRYVARFNTVNNAYFESHSLPGANSRGTRLTEIYNNTFHLTSTGGFSRPFFLRAGTGMIFHNTADANYGENHVDFNNQRSCENLPTVGFCDGTNFPDQNTPGQVGYSCRDQIGASTDTSYWSYLNSPSPQGKMPMYLWKNTSPGGEQTVVVATGNCDAGHETSQISQLAQNRDWYQYNASFNGTAGIGEGTLAARPATCTVGVGYWATDQGSWNQSNNGAGQGVFYQCTSPNIWALVYTPYTYPHPLQGGGGSQPEPPTGLQAAVH